MHNILSLGIIVLFCGGARSDSGAKPVTMDVKLEVNGEVVASPRMVVLSGERGSITQERNKEAAAYTIEAQPLLKDSEQVQISFVVSQLSGTQQKIIAKPRIITSRKRSASIEQKTGSQTAIKLSVTPDF